MVLIGACRRMVSAIILLTDIKRRFTHSMIETVAGPRDRTGAQGPVGGILGRLGYGSDKVVKL